ncbi:hypothetical protein THAOC_15870 [Thalassiosira oceanica]|uniref:LNR domain-containing protein n=1 Tax=Thalassiosira oceanica TaxID=159749 RepID=K0SYY5_THAOC|nr:hypothetical protein THAOC_15870 [Thalassiosira oceanica]|eukprot:EJK63467.1 hypothetical protein THAOC_15870 [Thalassiosira oceanica]
MLVQEMVCPVSSPAFEVACAAGGGTVKYFASDLFRCNDGIIGVMWRGYPSCVPASCTEDEALKFDGLLQKFLLSSPLYGYGDCAVVTDCEVGQPDNLGDGECDGNAYNTRPCEFDRGDCLVQNARYPLCNPRYPEWVGDGKCHSKDYNIEECGYDGGIASTSMKSILTVKPTIRPGSATALVMVELTIPRNAGTMEGIALRSTRLIQDVMLPFRAVSEMESVTARTTIPRRVVSTAEIAKRSMAF